MKDKIQYFRDIDFEKYNTFFLSIYQVKDSIFPNWSLVRPSTATHEDVVSNKMCSLEGAVISFHPDMSIQEMLVHCAIRGIQIDFIEILSEDEDNRWNYKVLRVIDCHKEDQSKLISEVNAPRYYMIRVNRKNCTLKFLVVDRFEQDMEVNFLRGEYDKKAVVASFKNKKDAIDFSEKLNKKNGTIQ